MAIYDGLELSNKNASNPFRDISTDILFERVNDVKESGARSTKRNHLFDSLTAIRSWDYTQMRIMGAGYNLSTQLPMEVLKDKLEALAEADPETFAKSIDSDDLKIRAVIKMAKDADVISFLPQENKWVFTGSNEIITTLDRKEGLTEMDQFAEFLKNTTNGKQIKAQLERLITAKRKKETA
jgi:hypothetical protein